MTKEELNKKQTEEVQGGMAAQEDKEVLRDGVVRRASGFVYSEMGASDPTVTSR